jgi:hypothetical protein
MSAIGPKQTSASAPHMSAFGGKADIIIYRRDIRFDPRRHISIFVLSILIPFSA